ncbi:MAG: PBP1A family penicillin-binding protein [Spirochaetes bacterium]|nr:PBP1A family penicillin-binding protein [Spirochaetota bacterium]
MRQVLDAAREAVGWIFEHKMLVFVYIPLITVFLLAAYTGFVYLGWQRDREAALDRLFKYKRLIDHTEELREGYAYRSADIDLKAKVVDIPTRIYDRNDEIIGEFFEQKREIVPYSYIPRMLVNAVLASEDRDFYKHRGISYQGILRAFAVNLTRLRVVQGGSTITQQLAKVLFTDMERSLRRKIYEAFCATEIEKRYDKQDILSMYLNLIYFGNGAYGVESTAKMFFGVSVRELDETECAMIVGVISNPLYYSPISNLNNSISKTRRIMKSLVDAGYMKQEAADRQFQRFLDRWDVVFDEERKAVSSLIGSFIMSTYRVNRAPMFNELIRRELAAKFGEDVVKKGGLSVYTTIDAARQDIAQKALQEGVLSQREYHMRRAEKMKDPKKAEAERANASSIEGALVSLDPATGEVLAHVGGYSFSSQNQVDHVTQIRRQPGSSFKPIVYAAAVEARDITPSTIIVDEKTVFGRDYAPRNYDGKYLGPVTARDALAKSINIVAVKVIEKTGYSHLFRILRQGLDLTDAGLSERFGKTPSMALGTYELSPLENCTLHSLLVNGGRYIRPYGVRYVKDYNGNVVWNNEEEVTGAVREKRDRFGKIIDPAACAVTVSMLKGVFEEGGTAAHVMKSRKFTFPVSGKTGTSSNYSDAWFVGYTSDMVTAVWVGNKKGAISLGEGRAGGVLSAGIWGAYAAGIYRDFQPGAFIVPEDGLTRQTICLDSGLVPHEPGLCPRVAIDELFISGTEPGEYCNLHTRPAEAEKR